MKYFVFICLLFSSSVCYSQLKVESTILNPSGQNVLVKVNYYNSSDKDYVIHLQNWRVIPLLENETLPIGFPQNSKLINFVFISRDSTKIKNKLLPLDWNVRSDSLPTGSFKIIKPGEEFEVSLSFKDSVLVETINEEPSLNLCLLHSVAEYKRTKDLLCSGNSIPLLYEDDSLTILDPAVNYEHYTNPAKPDLKKVYDDSEAYLRVSYNKLNNKFIRQLSCQ